MTPGQQEKYAKNIAKHQASRESMTLVFIGDANWDIYADDKGQLRAVPKPENPDCHETHFGDRNHIRRLMQQGYFNDEPTEAGLELMSGLHTRFYRMGTEKQWHALEFTHPSNPKLHH